MAAGRMHADETTDVCSPRLDNGDGEMRNVGAGFKPRQWY